MKHNAIVPYDEFMAKKNANDYGNGFEVDLSTINPMFFPYETDITAWALRKGRVLIGLNCGLGKGPIQMEWGKQVNLHTGIPIILFAPSVLFITIGSYSAQCFK